MTLSIFSVCLIYDHMHDFLAKGLLLQQLNTVVRQRVFGLEHMYFTVQPICVPIIKCLVLPSLSCKLHTFAFILLFGTYFKNVSSLEEKCSVHEEPSLYTKDLLFYSEFLCNLE